MTDKQQPEAPKCTAADGTTEIFNVPGRPLLVRAADFNRLHAENETLRAKLKVYEDLGDAADDVQLLRMGYAAARLEIESLKSQLAEHASHGQAPAGAGEPTEQQILEAAFAPAQPAVEASRFGSPELQAMIIARCVEKDQADSVQGDALDAAFEAVRLLLCGLERYSFVLDDDGVVRRVRDRVGNWIEFDAAHELFDPAAVDAARAAQEGK